MVNERLLYSLFTQTRMTLRNFFAITSALVLLLTCSASYADSVVASLDNSTVTENQIVQLTLRADFTNTGNGPDLNQLKKDFTILGQSQNSQFSFNLGANTALSYWVISLMPKAVGSFEIPPIKIGDQESQPLELTVKPAAQILDQNGNPPVMVTTQVTEQSPYLQQQVILTERLFTSVSLQNANLTTPSNPNLVIERLSDDQMEHKIIKGTHYQVLTRKYLVFPQKSGLINIAPQSVRAVANSASGKRIIKVQSEPTPLQVQPIPASYTSDNWIPSQALTLTSKLSSSDTSPKVGDTLMWTIEVDAKQTLPEQIPQLTFDSTSAYKLYPQPIKFSSTKGVDGITGHQVLKIEVVPTQAGTLTLPTAQITYWNTQTQSTDVATATAPSIEIAALPTTPQNPPKQDSTAQTNHGKPIAHQAKSDTAAKAQEDTGAPISLAKKAQPKLDDDSNKPSDNDATTAKTLGSKPFTWRQYGIIALSALLALCAILWLVIFRARKRQNQDKDAGVPTLQEFAPLNSHDEASAFKLLLECCRQDNLPQLRSYLLEWARHRWGDSEIRSVDDIKRLVSSVKLTQLLMEAELMMYSSQADNQWQGAALADALEEYHSGQPKKSQASQLKTLYPNF